MHQGSEMEDEEERLFMASLQPEEQEFLDMQKGLGNSQKAEVAWLESMGFEYEECDVREFAVHRGGSLGELEKELPLGVDMWLLGQQDPSDQPLQEPPSPLFERLSRDSGATTNYHKSTIAWPSGQSGGPRADRRT
jgi:hypothetical protein